MDTETGKLYVSKEAAMVDLRARGVSEDEIKRRVRPVDTRKLPVKLRLFLALRQGVPKNEARRRRRLARKG